MDARTIDPDCLPEVMNALALAHACEYLGSATKLGADYWCYKFKKEAIQSFQNHSQQEIERLIKEAFV